MTAPTPLSPTQPDWAERSRQAVWHPCTQMKVHEQFPPRAIVSAEGPWLVSARFSSIAALAIRLEMTWPLGSCKASKGDMG